MKMQKQWHDVDLNSFSRDLRLVVAGASVGTLIEWYDFFLYGAVTVLLAKVFFAGVTENLAYLFSLLTFAAGFLVRPFGSLLFGYIGDKWGRKNTFIVTMSIMGGATVSVGLIPSYHKIGILAPILLITTRLIQGFAVGGEYGGAATFVAEHAPANVRGFATSFIQLTCTFGLMLALSAVLVARWLMGNEAFEAYGWRVPFLASVLLLAISVWIRLRLDESALFKRQKEANQLSRSPVSESFKSWHQIRFLLLATFCLTGGMTVIFYTSQFYVLSFMQKTLHLADPMASGMLAIALLVASPFFILFGWLSDKTGRRVLVLSAFVIAAIAYYPLFYGLGCSVNPKLMGAIRNAPVWVAVDADECSGQFNVISPNPPRTVCDAIRRSLADAGVPYRSVPMAQGGKSQVRIGAIIIGEFPTPGSPQWTVRTAGEISDALSKAGYPKSADIRAVSKVKSLAILTAMVILVAMAYAPLAAMLVEMFPLRIRYTSLSFSYNLGVGWIGGLLPSVAYAIVVSTGRMFAGLMYPVIIASAAFILGVLFVAETAGADISI